MRYQILSKTLILIKTTTMKKIFRALLAGWGAKKLGGGCGCIGIIIVFIILWWLLGNLGL